MDPHRRTDVVLAVERLLHARTGATPDRFPLGDCGRVLEKLIIEELLEGSDILEGRRRVVRSGLVLGIPLRQLEYELDRLENLCRLDD
jgi:hypothetical protein